MGFLIFLLAVGLFFWWKSLRSKKETITKRQEDLDDSSKQLSDREDLLNERESQLNKKEKTINSKISEHQKIDEEINQLTQDKEELQNLIIDMDNETTNKLKTSSIDLDIPDDTTSSQLKNELALLKKEENALDSTDIELPYAKKRQVNNMKKKILLPFNSEVSRILNNLTLSNIDSSRKKIISTFEKINRIFSDDHASITDSLLNIKLKELEITYQYLVKRSQEKEQQKAIKEQMVEEERARRELEAENKKLNKEEQQFQNEINRLLKYLDKSSDEVQSQLYSDEIRELKQKLNDVQSRKEDVENRQANTRAGFVYIISNIGSFGDNVFKIGMTKRLNPMDRINELSSASVPFTFDVHAMIFSDDAPKLENELHQAFSKKAVNKINPRKEFYNVGIDDIESEISQNHPDAILQLTKVAKAEEYRRSLELASAN